MTAMSYPLLVSGGAVRSCAAVRLRLRPNLLWAERDLLTHEMLRGTFHARLDDRAVVVPGGTGPLRSRVSGLLCFTANSLLLFRGKGTQLMAFTVLVDDISRTIGRGQVPGACATPVWIEG